MIEVIELCRTMGQLFPQSYMADPNWVPHKWVIEAVLAAYEQGREDENESIRMNPDYD